MAGHSLGGALATFASWDARAIKNITVKSVYTFGAPRVGNDAFAWNYVHVAQKQGIHPPQWRIVHSKDITPRVPANFAGFAHQPQEVYFAQKRNWSQDGKTC